MNSDESTVLAVPIVWYALERQVKLFEIQFLLLGVMRMDPELVRFLVVVGMAAAVDHDAVRIGALDTFEAMEYARRYLHGDRIVKTQEELIDLALGRGIRASVKQSELEMPVQVGKMVGLEFVEMPGFCHAGIYPGDIDVTRRQEEIVLVLGEYLGDGTPFIKYVL